MRQDSLNLVEFLKSFFCIVCKFCGKNWLFSHAYCWGKQPIFPQNLQTRVGYYDVTARLILLMICLVILSLFTICCMQFVICYLLFFIICYCHSLVLILILISIKTRSDNIFGQKPPHPTPPTGNSTLLNIAQTIDISG